MRQWRNDNRTKTRKYSRDNKKTTNARIQQSDRRFRKRYGITWDEYWHMAAKQANLCAICNRAETAIVNGTEPARLSVDHDHTTNKIRELLCVRCNRGLGHFGDDIRLMEAAVAYLRRHGKE